MTKMLSYDDVVLVPKYSSTKSRSDCDTTVKLGKFTFALPVIPANMKCVINPYIGSLLMINDYFHIQHRFDEYGKILHDYEINSLQRVFSLGDPSYYSSISVGVKPADMNFVSDLARQDQLHPIDFITIDVAHGHHYLVARMIDHIKKQPWKHSAPFIIAGNIATRQAVKDLESAGADALKVGIGPGRACTTYKQTGFMSPMFSTVQACADIATVPIIADGGTHNNGDIAKAIVAGATMVMIGAQFTACIDSPAKTRVPWTVKNIKAFLNNRASTPPDYFKEYYGSASAFNGNTKNIEGTLVKLKGNGLTYLEKMHEITESLQSAISYAGGTTLSDLNSCKYEVIG